MVLGCFRHPFRREWLGHNRWSYGNQEVLCNGADAFHVPVVAVQKAEYKKLICLMIAGFLPCRTQNPKARAKVESLRLSASLMKTRLSWGQLDHNLEPQNEWSCLRGQHGTWQGH